MKLQKKLLVPQDLWHQKFLWEWIIIFQLTFGIIGIITYLLLTGYLPFDDEESDEEVIRKTLFENNPFDNDSWKKISVQAKEYIKKILIKDKEQRITIADILKDQLFEIYAQIEDENEA